MKSYTLENATEIQKEAPYTFYKPSDAIIDCLMPGEAIVKLIFAFEPDDPEVPEAERMWVVMDSLDEQGNYTGTLDNDPFYIKDLKAGDQIIFRREHIVQYDTLEELSIQDPLADRVEKYMKRCFVSNNILKDGYKVGRLYREDGDFEDYSGWTLMSDQETQDYVDDPNNLKYVSLGKVLNIDDSFIHLLDEPIGSNFARDKVSGKFFSIE